MRRARPAALLPALATTALLLSACSPPADQAWPPEDNEDNAVAPVEAIMEDSPAAAQIEATGRPLPRDFSDEEIAEARAHSRERRTALAEADLACRAVDPGLLENALGGEWGEGLFRWFESEREIAPALLTGTCVWQELELRTSVTLRTYQPEPLAWAALLAYDAERALRIHDRELADGPDIGQDSYRQPAGPEDEGDGTCAWLEEAIICLSASPAHTENWTELDAELIADIAHGVAGELMDATDDG